MKQKRLEIIAKELGLTKEEAVTALENYSKFVYRKNKGGCPSKIEKWYRIILESKIEKRIELLKLSTLDLSAKTWYLLRKKLVEDEIMSKCEEDASKIVYRQ